MAGGRKRRPKAGAGHGGKLPRGRAETGELPVLGGERRSEEAGVVRREGDGHAGAEEGEDRVPLERAGAGGVVRGQADVEGHPGADQTADERRVGGRGDAVGDPARLQPPERFGDGPGVSDLAGVDDGREAEAREAPVDGGEVARRDGELVPAEAEPDGARPGAPRVEVEDAVRGVRAEVPHRVEKDPDPARAGALVRGEDRLDLVPDGRPVEPEAVDDRRGDVDLGIHDPLPAEARGQVAGEEGEVGRGAEEAADVPVEGEEPGKTVEPPAGADRARVGEERRPGAPGEADEGRGPHGALEVEVELGHGREAEGARDVDGGHAGPSYGTPRREVFSLVPSERLWLRAAAFGLDLICLAGGPLLLATVVVFLVVLVAPEPPAGLPRVFRAAQALFVVLFLLRDAGGASPGKILLGLSVARGGGRVRPIDSVLRNLPLLVPGLNLFEAVSVVRRPDSRRLGDRLAGTTVGET